MDAVNVKCERSLKFGMNDEETIKLDTSGFHSDVGKTPFEISGINLWGA